MSQGILIFAEQRDGILPKITLELVSEGRRFADKSGSEVGAVLIGAGVEGLADTLAAYGADKVYLVDDPSLAGYNTDTYSQIFAGIVKEKSPAIVLLGATTSGRDLGARLSAKVGAGLASDCIKLELNNDGRLILTRPIYTGKVLTRVTLTEAIQIATVRPNTLPLGAMDSSRKGQVEKRPLNLTEPVKVKVLEVKKGEKQELDVAEADIVVSGGRGLGKKEGFNIVEELVSVLNAAMGASRAAVDSDWIEQSHQVGQTGKVIAPKLYIACGISGAIQHLVGMSAARCIVAINKDSEANIFQVADYGIVGDVYQVVPALVQELKKML